ncbi:Uma2 family endonuclease [Nocardiopsis sp. EMB25]|uniref:Uma2 family endonuclease n=1 Tax=Nocardiopsis sp. EMB25 TaxID=2835867 RepID=UPI0022844701|nr:Uma2 family endonuclease [Nocardiopsis sp. EMB25]MCY9784399.1 Uma2 family endonuclease [Nocardiopsis sp. EMB25]
MTAVLEKSSDARPTPISLRDVADHLDVPPGFRVEVLEGAIVMSPTPSKKHGAVLRRLSVQLFDRLPDDRTAEQMYSVEAPEGDDYATPDLMIVPVAVEEEDDGWLVSPDDVDCVVEVVSPGNAANDTKIKPTLYARWRIPVYLVIDPRAGTTRLYWDPKNGEYQARHDVEFGTDVVLPEPLKDVRIDTSVFPRYGG